jgi:Fic family protein
MSIAVRWQRAVDEEVCSTIKGARMAVRKVPGTKLANDATGEVIYTPPEVESRLRDKHANWERFVHDQQDIDPVVRMAVAHYQFEAMQFTKFIEAIITNLSDSALPFR